MKNIENRKYHRAGIVDLQTGLDSIIKFNSNKTNTQDVQFLNWSLNWL